MLQKGSLNYLAKEVFLPEMLFGYSLNLSTSLLTETIGIGTKKNVSKTRGIAESIVCHFFIVCLKHVTLPQAVGLELPNLTI